MKSMLKKLCRCLAAPALMANLVFGQGMEDPDVLSENCTATLLNRAVQVEEGGWFAIPNVQQEPGLFRVRVFCTEGGVTRGGQSDFIELSDDGNGIMIGRITLGELSPIPVSIRVTSPVSQLTSEGEITQLEATLTLPDGSTVLAPGREDGTAWSSSNDDIATVSATGLVTAVSQGRVMIRALNEGVQSTAMIEVLIPEDSDGDGLPDNYELVNGLNPNDPSDADADLDGDGLSNFEEFELGSNPRVEDTDGDGLLDGDELDLGTSLTTADSDGDGLNDGEEATLGTDPLLVDSDGDSIQDNLEIVLGTNPNGVDETTTIVGRLVDEEGFGVENATATVFDSLTALSSATGNFQIDSVPVLSGQVVVEALRILLGEVQTGSSPAVSLLSGGLTDVGEIVISTNDGLISGIVVDPFGEAVSDALVEVRIGDVLRQSRTDVFGRYLVSGVTEGSVDVQVTDFSTGLRARGGAQLQRNQSMVIDLELGAFGSIVGTVFQEDTMTPVEAGVSVSIRGAINDAVTTDFSGRYRFDFIPLGDFTLSAQDGDGNAGSTSTSISTTSTVVEVPITYLGQGVVQGVVLDAAGEPADGIAVQLLGQSFGLFRQFLEGTTDSDGRFSFDDVFVGDFTLRAVAAGSQTAATVLSEVGENGEVVSLNVTLVEAGMLRGRFFAEDGLTPLPSAMVTLIPSQITVETDTNGDYDFEFVPLDSYQIEALTEGGNFGETEALLTAQGQVENRDIVALGFGTVTVTVLDGGGQPVRGASVVASPEEGVLRSSNTNEEGQVSFAVLSGEVGITTTLSGSELGGGDLVTVLPNSEVESIVMLGEAGTIRGVAFSSDQEMTIRGARVRLTGEGLSRVITTDSAGGFFFGNVPLGLYNVQVLDSRGTVRFTSTFTLSQQGEVQELDAIFSALPSVIVNLSVEGNLNLQSIPISLRSLSPSAGSLLRAFSNGSGQAVFTDVPIGLFSLQVNFRRDGILFFGEASGEVVSGTDTVVDLALGNSVLPSRTTLSDANGFPYGIRENGRIQDGFASVFGVGSTGNTGANVLDVTSGGTTLRFTGSAVAQATQEGRELSIAEEGLHGLNVTRRVYVPQDGYFARQVESFTNPTSSPVTIDVTLSTHYRFNSRIIDGFITVREPRVLTTSSGDGMVQAGVDQWLVLDDDEALDPFLVRGTLPALTAVVEGEAAVQGPDDFVFAVDRSGTTGFGRVQTIWRELEIPAGETVSLLHFLSQQTEPALAIATAERLVQLPPEALLGIEPELAPTVVNFDVPTAGSALSPLPPRDGRVSGTVFAADGATIIPRSTVSFRSNSLFFGRTLRTTSREDGVYVFAEEGGFLLPRDGFMVSAVAPLTGESSVEFPSSFVAQEAEVDVVFGGTGILLGQVRRDTGEVVEGARVEVTGVNLLRPVMVLTDVAGNYRLTGLAPGTYVVNASLAITGGSGIGVSSSVTLSAGVTSNLDLTLEATGRLAGQVVNGGGFPQNTLNLILRGEGDFVRNIRTDTGGNYAFLDVPVGNYTLEVVEPLTRMPVEAAVSIQADLVTNFEFVLPDVGLLRIASTFSNGGPLSGGTVRLEGEDGRLINGRLNAIGELEIPLIVDTYRVTVTSPQGTELTAEGVATIAFEGEEVDLSLSISFDELPVVTVITPVDLNISESELGEFQITATASDDFEVSSVAVFLDGRLIQSDGFEPYRFNVTVPVVSEDQTLIYEVVAVDSAGQRSEAVEIAVDVINDVTFPSLTNLTLSPPENFSTYLAGESVTVTVQASDEGTGIGGVSFFANSELLGRDSFPSPNFAWRFNIPADLGSNGAEPLVISAVAENLGGNTSRAEITISVIDASLVDFTPPVFVEFSLSEPESPPAYRNREIVTVTVEVEDSETEVDTVAFFLNEQQIFLDSRERFVRNFSIPDSAVENGAETLVVSAVAVDLAGNEARTELTIPIVEDPSPTGEIVSPEIGQSFTEGEMVTFRVNAEDDEGVSFVRFRAGGVFLGDDREEPYEFVFPLASGEDLTSVELSAEIWDFSNLRTTITRVVTRLDDTIAPELELVSPVAGSVLSQGTTDLVIAIDSSSAAAAAFLQEDIDGDGQPDRVIERQVAAARQVIETLDLQSTRVVIDFFDYTEFANNEIEEEEIRSVLLSRLDALLSSSLNRFARLSPDSLGPVNLDLLVRFANERLLTAVNVQIPIGGSTPILLLFVPGADTLSEELVQEAADGGVVVNSLSFSVDTARNERLENLSAANNGQFVSVLESADFEALIPGLVPSGVRGLPVVVNVSDDIVVEKVEYRVEFQNSDLQDVVSIVREEPFSFVVPIPNIQEPTEVELTVVARDFGVNESEEQTTVVLLPGVNRPEVLRVEEIDVGVGAVDDSAILPGQRIRIVGRFFEPRTGNSVTLDGDRVSIAVFTNSTTELIVDLPRDATSGELVVDSTGVLSQPFALTLSRLPEAEVEFALNLPDGTPLSGSVEILDSYDRSFRRVGNLDAEGRLTLPGVAGSYTVRVNSSDVPFRFEFTGEVEIDGQNFVETGDLDNLLTDVVVRLVDTVGLPIAGQSVSFLQRGVNRFDREESPLTDANGEVTLVNISPGLLEINFVGSGDLISVTGEVELLAGEGDREIELLVSSSVDLSQTLEFFGERDLWTFEASEGEEVTIELSGRTLPSEFFFNELRPLETPLVEIYDFDGNLIGEGRRASAEEREVSFTFTAPSSGAYLVIATSDEFEDPAEEGRIGSDFDTGGYLLRLRSELQGLRRLTSFEGAELELELVPVNRETGEPTDPFFLDGFVRYRQLNGPRADLFLPLRGFVDSYSNGLSAFENVPFGLGDEPGEGLGAYELIISVFEDYYYGARSFEIGFFGEIEDQDGDFRVFEIPVTDTDVIIFGFLDSSGGSRLGLPEIQFEMPESGGPAAKAVRVSSMVENERYIIEMSEDLKIWHPQFSAKGLSSPTRFKIFEEQADLKRQFYRVREDESVEVR